MREVLGEHPVDLALVIPCSHGHPLRDKGIDFTIQFGGGRVQVGGGKETKGARGVVLFFLVHFLL
jgi:hypothetical protein